MFKKKKKLDVKMDKRGRLFSAEFNNYGSFYTKLGPEKYKEWLKEVKKPHTRPKPPGRNEKCPCGSGKKYKKCCL